MLRSVLAVLLIVLAGVGAAGYRSWNAAPIPENPPTTPEVAPVPNAQAAVAKPAEELTELTLLTALERKAVEVEMIGNGRERLQVKLRSRTTKPLGVTIFAGDTMSARESVVVALRSAHIELPEMGTATKVIQIAAVNSTAATGEARYFIANSAYPRLTPLLTYLKDHPETTPEAVQTAVLALTENLPVRAFAKFPVAGDEMPSSFDSPAFRVEVADIIMALGILREIGIPDEELALTVDPQLRIEATIDPLAHAAAMRYYGIPASGEWDYWKNELINGDIRTRHYALYGIARFFPDVALRMLPQWARERQTHVVFRQSALLALAETQRHAAAPILAQLSHELGPETELGRTAQKALDVLNRRLDHTPPARMAVAFRASFDVPKL